MSVYQVGQTLRVRHDSVMISQRGTRVLVESLPRESFCMYGCYVPGLGSQEMFYFFESELESIEPLETESRNA